MPAFHTLSKYKFLMLLNIWKRFVYFLKKLKPRNKNNTKIVSVECESLKKEYLTRIFEVWLI
jgi:hypothetical protein